MHRYVREIRVYPLNPLDYPTEEYAKLCILNGFKKYTGFYNFGNCNSH